VPLGGGETVDGLQKGLISGLFGNSYSTSKRLKQYEVCKYQYIIPLGGNTIDLYAINKGVWDQISSADQKVILDVFEEVTVNFYPAAFDAEFKDIMAFYKSQGAATEDLPAAEWAKLKKLGEEVVIADWLKQMKDRGAPGDDWINRYKAKVQQFSK
jgi:TRAP-type C4-dicarboxylate transport system substrate-binding protein